MIGLIGLFIVVMFLAFIFSFGTSRENAIIGVPNGQAPAFHATMRQYEDARGVNRTVPREDNVIKVVPEGGLPQD